MYYLPILAGRAANINRYNNICTYELIIIAISQETGSFVKFTKYLLIFLRMAYNLYLADRIRNAVEHISGMEEKKMFGGIGFILNEKMCLGVHKEELMVRVLPEETESLLERPGTKIFDMTGKPMKGWMLVESEGYEDEHNFQFWIQKALEANPLIPISKSKMKK